MREAIAAKERVPTPRRYLSEDAIAEINKILNSLQKGQLVTVIYYGEYEQDYLQLTGPVFKVDPYWHSLQIESISIDFSEIYALMPN
ncbi:MAG: YolD-like family protein [Oscillospiraceae bacterium]|nr:YolD-like family protein [Oscillospiraceae bacterium]